MPETPSGYVAEWAAVGPASPNFQTIGGAMPHAPTDCNQLFAYNRIAIRIERD